MTRVELAWLIGDLSQSCVKSKACGDVEAVADLCDHLERVQAMGNGDLALWQHPPLGSRIRDYTTTRADRTLALPLACGAGMAGRNDRSINFRPTAS